MPIPTRMKISPRGVNFIKQWEGFIPFLYDDLVKVGRTYGEWKGGKLIGTLTIGYGHTKMAHGKYPMVVGTRITEARATQLLDEDLDPVEAYVNKVVNVPLTQGQFDALVSITFNFGEGNLKKSALLARLNAGNYAGARSAFGAYVYSKGKRLQGLANRRAAEQKLWDLPDSKVLAKGKVVDLRPDEYSATNRAELAKSGVAAPATPKEIDQPVSPNAAKTAEGASGITTSTIGTGGMIEQGSTAFDKAGEYASKAGELKYTAESLGVEPMGIANLIGPKAAAFFGYLFSSPMFWVFLALTILGAVIFFAKRYAARQEILPGEYEMAGTPLPTLIHDDHIYAGVDTSSDPDTRFYRVDPIDVTTETDIDVPVEIQMPGETKRRKVRLGKAKKKAKAK